MPTVVVAKGRRPGFLRLLMVTVLLAGVLTPQSSTPYVYAQGCSLCRDSTAGTAPQAQKAIRRAIPVLSIPATILFGVLLLVVARRRR